MNLKELEKEAQYQGEGGTMCIEGGNMLLLLKAFRAAQKWAKWAKDYQRKCRAAVPPCDAFDADEIPLVKNVINAVHDVETGWKMNQQPKLGDEVTVDGKVYVVVDVMARQTPYGHPNQEVKVTGYTVGLKEKR